MIGNNQAFYAEVDSIIQSVTLTVVNIHVLFF